MNTLISALSGLFHPGSRLRRLAAMALPCLALGLALGCGAGNTSSSSGLTITSFTPTYGQAGTLVTVTGTGFTATSGITICGVTVDSGTNYPNNQIVSDSEITFDVPAVTTTGPIVLTTSSGSTTSGQTFDVVPTINATPSPSSGPAGTAVIITGNGLLGVTGATFNGVGATLDPSYTTTATQIVYDVPTGVATGAVTLSLLNGYGLSPATTSFTVTSGSNASAPTVTSFSPAYGETGTAITLVGTNLTSVTAITIGGVAATPFSTTSTTATFDVPLTALNGAIIVTSAAGNASSSGSFDVVPAITSPAATVSHTAAASVVIQGSGLAGVTAVSVNGSGASFSNQSATSLTVAVPSGETVGNGEILLTYPYGNGSVAVAFTVD